MINFIGEGSKFSERQKQVLQMAAEGRPDKEIAQELGISLGTLRTYWDRLRIRHSVQSRTELIARILLAQLAQVSRERDALRMELGALRTSEMSPHSQAQILELTVA